MALNNLANSESPDRIGQPSETFATERAQAAGGQRRGWPLFRRGRTSREVNLALIRDVAAGTSRSAPGLSKATSAIRHFAGRYLSQEVPHSAVIGVLSCRAGEGRTTVALGLAGALAEMYERVVLIELETDQAAPPLSTEMDLDLPVGLRDYLAGNAPLSSIVFPTQKENLWFLPAGAQETQSSRLDGTARTRQLMTDLNESFDVVVVDLPPLLSSEQAPGLLGGLTAVVLVVSSGTTTTDEVKQAVGLCGRLPVKGVLLNKARPKTPGWLSSLFRS
jgi:Mrp family chromosome partitioning ATPase